MTLQLEEGKFYRSAAGIKVGPMRRTSGGRFKGAGHVLCDRDGVSIGNYPQIYTVDGSVHDIRKGEEDHHLVAEWVDEPVVNTPEMEAFGELPDIKATILDQAGKIVNGARRSAYGTPENNFERIARFWQAYFDNTGREVQITAADVSPMMRLMKEARLCETPDHYDSFVDIVGYTLTGAEVNRVKSA